MASDIRAQGSLIGSKLGGYQVEALVGRGAMGSVYLARDTKLNRHIALKVLLGSLARTPSIVKQFHQEAQAAAPLNHPNIVRIYSAGTESGTPYIAMEFVDGEPLDRFLKRKGKVGWDVALHVGAQVAQALDCAHQHGIVHRDVKPSNILVDRRGGVRLTDFGIARMQSSQAGGPVIGTPQYMSPEQATGGEVWPASDLFSLGVTMYQMISGEMPFKGESSMSLIRSICEDDPPRLNKLVPDVPDDVARLVAYLLEKEPTGRPASAKVAFGLIRRLQKHRGETSVMVESLTAFLQEEMEPRPFSSLERREAQSRKKSSQVRRKLRRKWLTGGLIAQAAVIAVLAAGAFSIGPLMAARGREKAPVRATVLNMATVEPVRTGVRRISLFAEGHRVDALTWLNDSGVLLAQTRGQRGTLADGARGLVSIDVPAATVMSLSAPVRSDTTVGRPHMIPTTFNSAIPPTSGPFAGNVPIFAPGEGPDTAVLLVQPWNAATPRAEILFTAPLSSVSSPEAHPTVAIQPSGDRICVALFDPETGMHYLVEHQIGSRVSIEDERRTVPRADILPWSLQYTPDGRRIAYLRRSGSGGVELWMTTSSIAELDGRPIAKGLAAGPVAYSSDGAYVAAEITDIDGSRQVALFDFKRGEFTGRYGPGHLSPQAWLPDGSGFVFAGPDNDPQLMLASAQAPFNARPVTSFANGAGPAYAVDPVSGQVAAADRDAASATIYLLEPDTISGGAS